MWLLQPAVSEGEKGGSCFVRHGGACSTGGYLRRSGLHVPLCYDGYEIEVSSTGLLHVQYLVFPYRSSPT